MTSQTRIRKAYASKGDDATLSRFVKLTTAEREAAMAKRSPSTRGRKPVQQWLPNLRHKALENAVGEACRPYRPAKAAGND